MLTKEEKKTVKRVEHFVKEAFIENPHYSFGHWTVMYDHSRTVASLAGTIAESVGCDELLVVVGALLHDIGKTHKADQKTLHLKHELFNLPISEVLLNTIDISPAQLAKLRRLVAFEDDSAEMKVIKDADALALPSDKRLYMLYIEWAYREGFEDSIQRKLDKEKKLRFEISKKMGAPLFATMKKDWDEYIRIHS